MYTYLSLRNLGKEDGKWKIKVTNPQSFSIRVYYNEKMCNESDAKNWSNLSDIESISISAKSFEYVLISSNWFATSIVFSYYSNGARLITYAKGLSTSGGITMMYNIIK